MCVYDAPLNLQQLQINKQKSSLTIHALSGINIGWLRAGVLLKKTVPLAQPKCIVNEATMIAEIPIWKKKRKTWNNYGIKS